MADPYLVRLAARLLDGLERIPADTRDRHAQFLRTKQNPDGGFSGREGGSDLYYTGFALRGLVVLQAVTEEISARAAGFLKQSLATQTSLVDFFSLVYSAFLVQFTSGVDVFADSPPGWDDRIIELLSAYRTVDGGYAKSAGSVSGSTYHTFLVGLCFELLNKPLPNPEQTTQFILSRRREDGGFVEIAPMKRSGTNPTAAAVGMLSMIDEGAALTAEITDGVIEFLADMPSVEGGLRANGRAPLADLLSTFTGLWTLETLGASHRVDRGPIHEYVDLLQHPAGGFRGGLWDEQTDVEYSFYGLGCLGLLGDE